MSELLGGKIPLSSQEKRDRVSGMGANDVGVLASRIHRQRESTKQFFHDMIHLQM